MRAIRRRRFGRTKLLLASAALVAVSLAASCGPVKTITEVAILPGCTAGSLTIPSGVTSIFVEIYGAGGGNGTAIGAAGGGGYSAAMIPVTPGETLTGVSGCFGEHFDSPNFPGQGGPGAGNGGNGVAGGSGGGGGGSALARGSTLLLAAGGGGGDAGASGPGGGGGGGGGGGLAGQAGEDGTVAGSGGQPGTQTQSGAGGIPEGGVGATQFDGGNGGPSAVPGGGGGGGYYGGGGGGSSLGISGGGGGGSGFGPAGTAFQTGVTPDDGLIVVYITRAAAQWSGADTLVTGSRSR